MIEMGTMVKDRITGFEGIVTARIEYITGCVQYAVTPNRTDKDGKRMDAEFIDELRLEIVTPIAPDLKHAMDRSRVEAPGGPSRDAPKGVR